MDVCFFVERCKNCIKAASFEAEQVEQASVMRIPFQSAWQLKSHFAAIGLDFRIVQLTAGPLSGLFELGGHPSSPVLSIKTNQGLLFEGTRHPQWTPIALENTHHLELHRVRGETVGHHCVHGFNRLVTESFFQISPGAHTTIGLLNSARLWSLIEQAKNDQVFDVMETTNSVRVSPQLFEQIQALLRPDTTTEPELHEELLQAALLNCLQPGKASTVHSGDLTQGSHLMHELIRWGTCHPTAVIKLEDLSRQLFASRSTIVQNCRTTFGLGPMALLKQIRLGQVQHTLSRPQLQQQIGCNNVQSIAAYYGFSSRNHFARDYRQLFGEAPSQTLQRAADPGMGVHSVSIAQIPQMAIARR